ncbi:MAG TPA: hypothetical protein VEC06_06395 [Paucimonas sp.]|nr:hypothetical protein [Paucimonas sp.]
MTIRDALFAGAVVALASLSAAAMVTSGQLPYGGKEVRAQAVGFDALAQRVFGGSDFTAGVERKAGARESVQ